MATSFESLEDLPVQTSLWEYRWHYTLPDRLFTCMDCGFTIEYALMMNERNQANVTELFTAHQLLHKLNHKPSNP